MRFAAGAVLAVVGVALLFGAYTSWLALLLSWVRRVSRVAVPIALIAAGAYVVWGARNGRFDRFADHMGTGRGVLIRSSSDRRVAGVCGGIAQYFGIESMFVRTVAVLLGLASPLLTLIVYGVLAAVLSRA